MVETTAAGRGDPDLERALRATNAAANVIRDFAGRPLDVRHKSPGQPLTEADLAADRTLRDILVGDHPQDGWLSEESAASPDRRARDRVWIVDPIDGTRSFIAGRPEFSVSVGLCVGGSPYAGVIHNPATREVFWAVRGRGAWTATEDRMQQPQRLAVDAHGGLLLASRSDLKSGWLAALRGWEIQPMGSTAYKLALVAAGRAAGYLTRGVRSEWDLCAAILIIEEAGGRITDSRGRPLGCNRAEPHVRGVIAAADALHERLLDHVRSVRKEEP